MSNNFLTAIKEAQANKYHIDLTIIDYTTNFGMSVNDVDPYSIRVNDRTGNIGIGDIGSSYYCVIPHRDNIEERTDTELNETQYIFEVGSLTITVIITCEVHSHE